MSAMMYPLVLLFLAISVLIFLLVFFIPRFQTLFAGFDAKLPMITQIIVGISDFVRHYGIFAAAGLGVAAYMSRAWFKQESSRRLWESWLLKSPVVGPL